MNGKKATFPVVIDLKSPVKFGSEIISRLSFNRKPQVRDMKGMTGKLDVDSMILLIGRLTAQPPSLIEELDMEDFLACAEVVGGFFQSGQQTGHVQ